MKAIKIAVALAVLLMGADALWAATEYGTATIEKGQMTVVRDGQRIKFSDANKAIPIMEGDLLRVRRDSSVVLQSREQATLTLGSNAVFHVQPWEARGKTGLAKMLFGRMRASVATLAGGQRFNVKTATATIGVKGTEFGLATSARGNTMLVVIESIVSLLGNTGLEQDVHPGQMSIVVGSGAATRPVTTPPNIEQSFEGDNMDSSDDLPGQEGLPDSDTTGDRDLNVEVPLPPNRARVNIGF